MTGKPLRLLLSELAITEVAALAQLTLSTLTGLRGSADHQAATNSAPMLDSKQQPLPQLSCQILHLKNECPVPLMFRQVYLGCNSPQHKTHGDVIPKSLPVLGLCHGILQNPLNCRHCVLYVLCCTQLLGWPCPDNISGRRHPSVCTSMQLRFLVTQSDQDSPPSCL